MDNRLTQVLANVENEIADYTPGTSRQLTPAAPVQHALVEVTSQNAADLVALYQRRVEEAQRRLETVKQIAERMVTAALEGEV